MARILIGYDIRANSRRHPAHTGALGQRWASGGQSLYLVN